MVARGVILDSGEVDGIDGLGAPFKADTSYIGRILRLATLAPDIVEVIVEGNEPNGVSLNRLTAALPMAWEEQQQALGFTSQRIV